MSEYQLARTLRDVFNAANPLLPLPSGDPRYVDCTEVRGNEDVVTQLFQCITWSDTITSQLFTGHRGCGKSTELLRLRQRLTDANYAVIYFEADEIIDIEDTEYTDVLVAIALQVFEGLKTLGVNLSDDLLESVFAWFAEVVYEQENIQVAQIAQLLDKINLLLRSGEAQLRKRGQSGLVVIKVHGRDNTPAPDGLAKWREILAQRIDLSLIFEEEGLAALCKASGGHPRILMTLVRNACTYAVNRFPKPIDANAAERAINRLVSEFSRSIPEEHFPLLVQVYRRKQVNNDEPHRLMLQNLSVLEYINGAPPWQDVQPVVVRLDKFQKVLADGT